MDTRGDIRAVFDRIAPHFSATREHPWPEVETFLESVGEPTIGLDIGCGNGRHAVALEGVCAQVVGVDLSRRLLEIAADRTDAELLQGDAVLLPIRTGVVDIAVYVATIHHLPTAALRRASLAELDRVLAPGGRALVSAWSTADERFDETEGFDTTLTWTLPDGEEVDRFYHIFDPGEFEAMLGSSSLVVEDMSVSSGNCYAVVTSSDEKERT
ncbi:MAG: class I SAM-dependent methyltransferase [Natrialbaceae archaeon]|nr:class I SAM-dependent methyltransferase [Natrialbaceae archaeon]